MTVNPTIIELSRENATVQNPNHNSVFETTLKEGLNVSEGDTIILRNCFLDVQKDEGDDIVLEQDTDVHLTYGYYEYNSNFADKVRQNNGPNAADFLPYMAYESNTERGTLNGFRLNANAIPRGTRTPNGTFYVDVSISYQLRTGEIKQAFLHNVKFVHNAGDAHADSDGGFTPIQDVITTSVRCLNGNTDTFKYAGVTFDTATFIDVVGTEAHLKTGHTTIHLLSGTYNPDTLAETITNSLQDLKFNNGQPNLKTTSEFLFRTDDGRDYSFQKIGTTPGQEQGYTFDPNEKYWVGASQVALKYNSESAPNVFSFDYMHSPFFDNHEESVRIYRDANDDYHLQDRQSGIFLVDLQPRAFWVDQLGFVVDNTLVELGDNAGIKYFPDDGQIFSKTTRQFSGLQTLFPDGDMKIPDPEIPHPPQNYGSETTFPLSAGTRLLKNNGHYLIELGFSATKQKYLFKDSDMSHVFGIVSAQYVSNGYVTGFSDSAIPYTHEGRPFTLQNIRVRILDPSTKQPVSLGPNSTLYMEVSSGVQN